MDHHNTGAFPTDTNRGHTSQTFVLPPGGIVGVSSPPQRPDDHLLSAWWKQLVAFCLGLSAFGIVAYAVASKFFLPREDFAEFSESLNLVKTQMDTNLTYMTTIKEAVQANTHAVQRFDRVIAAEGLSEEAAREVRRERKRKSK